MVIINLNGDEKMHPNLHPVTITKNMLLNYFVNNGFKLKQFGEIRTLEEEFESVRIIKNNPVRDYGRTFYLDDEHVLQAHMTAIRDHIKKCGDGKYIIPGRVYRVNREKSIRNIIFHQMEGYISEKNFTLNQMNELINNAYYNLGLEPDSLLHTFDFTKFTSPTIQYYYRCHICNGKGCEVCEQKGTICFAAGGVESESWDETKSVNLSFCLSIDRLAMVKFGFDNMRNLYEG